MSKAKVSTKLTPEEPERRLEWVALAKLKPAKRNPKRHDLKAVGTSVARFGYVEPMVLDERTGRLVAGHGRREALMKMRAADEAPPSGVRVVDGEWCAPVLRGWSSRSDAEAEAYLLASNRLVEVGGWSDEDLAVMLRELGSQDALDGVGFSEDDIGKLLASAGAAYEPTPEDDEVPEPPEEKDVWVKPGDLFRLGEHRILCGDSTKAEDVAMAMCGEKARICWTDPPWNVGIGTHSAYGDKKKQRPIANDNLGTAFPAFCRAFAVRIFEALEPGAHLYLAMSTQEWAASDLAIREAGFHWSTVIIWSKDRLILSQRDYHTQYEPIWYGWRGDAPRLHPLEDRTQSDVWDIPRPARSEEHPTMKPVELVARALSNSSRKGDLVFEPFSGSGTTIIAAERTGRRCFAIELEPKYVQVAIERWEKLTGKTHQRLE